MPAQVQGDHKCRPYKCLANTRQPPGFTLVETLVAMMLVGIFSLALYGFYRLHVRVLKVEETRLNLRDSSRLALDFMVRELHMAGARPVRPSACDGFERLTAAEAQRVTMQYDFRGNSASAPSDGCPDDPSERIAYEYDGDEQMLKRATGAGSLQPFISDVPPDGFTLRYFDRFGAELTSPLSSAQRAAVRGMKIDILTRVTHPDPAQTEPLEAKFSSTVAFVNPPN
ncbi:MAG: prepilin-type N-terminal cleavage/methylation domain-containing protein [Deltaproteobacteria bacterium]|nr:prepilin-type N-terminal cleavage/methylation domain-containing protein [Deltaproteobacteria bacterium]